LLSKRLTTDLDKIRDESLLVYEAFSNKMDQFCNSNLMSTIDEDKNAIITALAHLQQVYELNMTDLVRGMIDGKKYRDDLSADDIYEIGFLMSVNNECERAAEWLKEALKRLESDGDKAEIYETMRDNYLKCNQTQDAKFISSLLGELKAKQKIETQPSDAVN
jgi:hypothetical protein